jgi:hypothetical protein
MVWMVVGMRTVVDIQADPVALLRQLDRAGAGADMRTLRTDGPDTRANIEEYAPLWSLAPHVMGSPATSGLANPGGMPPVTVHGFRSMSPLQPANRSPLREASLSLAACRGMPHSCCA